jgi:RNA polymerase sigma-70 factor (ECF subfamily)
VARPAARDVRLKFTGAGVYDVEPAVLPDLFHGMPLRVYGRSRGGSLAKVQLQATVHGREFTRDFTVERQKGDDAGDSRIERMWATHRIERLRHLSPVPTAEMPERRRGQHRRPRQHTNGIEIEHGQHNVIGRAGIMWPSFGPDGPVTAPDSEHSDVRTSRLIRAFRDGELETFATVYARLTPALYGWASLRIPRSLQPRLDADDLVQEVWRRALERLPTYDSAIGSFRAWVFGVARHVLLQQLRGARARGGAATASDLDAVPAEVTSITQRLARDDAMRRFLDALLQLAESDQRLVLLRGFEDRSFADIAALEQTSVETAKKRWQRLRGKLLRLPTPAGLLTDLAEASR